MSHEGYDDFDFLGGDPAHPLGFNDQGEACYLTGSLDLVRKLVDEIRPHSTLPPEFLCQKSPYGSPISPTFPTASKLPWETCFSMHARHNGAQYELLPDRANQYSDPMAKEGEQDRLSIPANRVSPHSGFQIGIPEIEEAIYSATDLISPTFTSYTAIDKDQMPAQISSGDVVAKMGNTGGQVEPIISGDERPSSSKMSVSHIFNENLLISRASETIESPLLVSEKRLTTTSEAKSSINEFQTELSPKKLRFGIHRGTNRGLYSKHHDYSFRSPTSQGSPRRLALNAEFNAPRRKRYRKRSALKSELRFVGRFHSSGVRVLNSSDIKDDGTPALPSEYPAFSRIRVWENVRGMQYYDCVCGSRKPIQDLKSIKKHVESHDRTEFQCSMCDKRFERTYQLNAHKRIHRIENNDEVYTARVLEVPLYKSGNEVDLL